MTGPLIILSGPSGSGKSTVIRRVVDSTPRVRLSISATTRSKRATETDGVDYYFWTRDQFEAGLQADAFLEHATVYGNYYGTLKAEVEPYRQQDWCVILDIDTQGAAHVRQKCPEVARVLLRASSMAAYEQRLRYRHTDDEATIQKRLAGAQRELERAADYDDVVINDDLETAVAQFRTIVQQQLERKNNHAG